MLVSTKYCPLCMGLVANIVPQVLENIQCQLKVLSPTSVGCFEMNC